MTIYAADLDSLDGLGVAPSLIRDMAGWHERADNGGDVARWFHDLPRRVQAASAKYGLSFGTLLPDGTMSACFPARRHDGREVVVKFSPPWANGLAEAQALQIWDGRGAALCLEWDPGSGPGDGVLMLERLTGPQLAITTIGCDSRYVAALLRELHPGGIPAGVHMSAIPSFTDGVNTRMNRAIQHKDVTAGMLDLIAQTRPVAQQLLLTVEIDDLVVCHADLADRNCLWTVRDAALSRATLATIDPMPCFGEVAYDAGMWAALSGMGGGVALRAAILAQELNLVPERVLGWAVVDAACELPIFGTDVRSQYAEFIAANIGGLADAISALGHSSRGPSAAAADGRVLREVQQRKGAPRPPD